MILFTFCVTLKVSFLMSHFKVLFLLCFSVLNRFWRISKIMFFCFYESWLLSTVVSAASQPLSNVSVVQSLSDCLVCGSTSQLMGFFCLFYSLNFLYIVFFGRPITVCFSLFNLPVLCIWVLWCLTVFIQYGIYYSLSLTWALKLNVSHNCCYVMFSLGSGHWRHETDRAGSHDLKKSFIDVAIASIYREK